MSNTDIVVTSLKVVFLGQHFIQCSTVLLVQMAEVLTAHASNIEEWADERG